MCFHLAQKQLLHLGAVCPQELCSLSRSPSLVMASSCWRFPPLPSWLLVLSNSSSCFSSTSICKTSDFTCCFISDSSVFQGFRLSRQNACSQFASLLGALGLTSIWTGTALPHRTQSWQHCLLMLSPVWGSQVPSRPDLLASVFSKPELFGSLSNSVSSLTSLQEPPLLSEQESCCVLRN